MKYASATLELSGMASAAFGCYQLASWLGWVVAGVCAVVVGQALGGNTP